jgi:hypothetical protein
MPIGAAPTWNVWGRGVAAAVDTGVASKRVALGTALAGRTEGVPVGVVDGRSVAGTALADTIEVGVGTAVAPTGPPHAARVAITTRAVSGQINWTFIMVMDCSPLMDKSPSLNAMSRVERPG